MVLFISKDFTERNLKLLLTSLLKELIFITLLSDLI